MMKSEKINAYVATLAVWNVKLHNILGATAGSAWPATPG